MHFSPEMQKAIIYDPEFIGLFYCMSAIVGLFNAKVIFLLTITRFQVAFHINHFKQVNTSYLVVISVF